MIKNEELNIDKLYNNNYFQEKIENELNSWKNELKENIQKFEKYKPSVKNLEERVTLILETIYKFKLLMELIEPQVKDTLEKLDKIENEQDELLNRLDELEKVIDNNPLNKNSESAKEELKISQKNCIEMQLVENDINSCINKLKKLFQNDDLIKNNLDDSYRNDMKSKLKTTFNQINEVEQDLLRLMQEINK